MARAWGLLLGLGVVLHAERVRAEGTFDAEGNFAFEPRAIVTVDFERAPPPGFRTRASADALEGARYAVLDTRHDAPLPVVGLRDSDTSYRATMFARRNRVVADLVVQYPNALGDTPASFDVRFFPTGRVTSDGWYEIATAPFSVEGSREPTVSVFLYANDADIDAFEVVEDGPFVPWTRCETPSAGDDAPPPCGDGAYCAAGFCRDGALTVPPLPDEAHRGEVIDSLAARLRLFFGGRATRAARLPIALATIEDMRRARDAWTFWNLFATAIHRLHDWHTSMSGRAEVPGRGAFPVCFVEGDADLSHDRAPRHHRYPDVLVSHVGPRGNSGLGPGDRLVAVDGAHPIAWAEGLESIDWGYWRADDPDVHAESVERLRILIRRYARALTIVRCAAGTLTCSPPETLLVRELPDEEPAVYPECDHRPRYHFAEGGPNPVTHRVFDAQAGASVFHGPIRDGRPGESIHAMVWNDVLFDEESNPFALPLAAMRDRASGVILDHRTGNGGTELGAEYLTQLFRAPAIPGVATGYLLTAGLLDEPFSADDGLKLWSARLPGPDAFVAGSANARTDLKTALLLARDGSASDWLAFGLKGSPNVRLFGRTTAGAFSSFVQFDYFGQFGWKIASGDLIREDGTTHLGEGVQPDEAVLPKQSDLLVGKDTAFERALAWLRSP